MADRVKMAIIGTGSIVQGHIEKLLAMPEVALSAFADISPQSLERTRARHGDAVTHIPTFADYKAMLAETELDAVLVAAPHTLHFPMAMDSLNAGCHVLLEKPMVNKVSEAHALLKKIDETKKVVGLCYQRHTLPHFRYIKEKIASGEFGEVQFIAALQQQGWAKGTAGSWRQDPVQSGGGQINDSGSHLLDIVLWTTGLAPKEVAAFMDSRGTPVDINSALSIKFTNGAQGNLSVVGDAAGWYEDITIWCDSGTFYVRSDGTFRVQGIDGKTFAPDLSEMPVISNIDTNFVHAVLGAEEIAAAPINGLRTIELTEAAWQSARNGGKVTPVVRA